MLTLTAEEILQKWEEDAKIKSTIKTTPSEVKGLDDMEINYNSEVHFKKHRVFRETPDVIFYDISVEESNASDLVIHDGPATSPPDDMVGAKQFYIHK